MGRGTLGRFKVCAAFKTPPPKKPTHSQEQIKQLSEGNLQLFFFFCQSRFCLKQSLDNVLNLNRYLKKISCPVESKHCGFNAIELVGPLLDFLHVEIDHSCAWRRTSSLFLMGKTPESPDLERSISIYSQSSKGGRSLHG